MASRVFHFTTVANTNPVPVPNAGNPTAISGYEIASTAATAVFVKFYWGNANSFSSSKDIPTVGTDAPSITVVVPVGSTTPQRVFASWTQDVAPRGNGALFMAVTGGIADSDNTAPAAGVVISVTYW